MPSTDIEKRPPAADCEKHGGGDISPSLPSAASNPLSSRPVPQPPPDGGLEAWLQVLAGHLMAINALGYTNTFGFFQNYFTTALHQSPSNISWVGSIQAFVGLFIAAFAGRAVDAGHFYPLVVAGVTLQLLGIFMTSLVTEYWHLLLAQGICQGLGAGLVITPVMTVVATYFSTKRAVAMCGVSSGSATGGVILPLIARQLLGSVGIAWTVRVFGLVCLVNSVVALAILRPRVMPRKGGALIALDAFGDMWFGIFAGGMFLVMLGLYFCYFYVTAFAQDVLSAPPSTSLTYLLVINALGIPGRFIPAYLSDQYVGPQNMLIIIVALTGMMDFVWAGIHTFNGLWGLVVTYGFVAAGIQSFTAPVLATAGRDPARIGGEMGMMFTVMSLGQLAGPPIAGALIERDGANYLYAQMFAGSVIVGGALLFVASRVLSGGWKWKKC